MGNDADEARLQNVWLPEDKLPAFREYAVGFFEECRRFQMERYVNILSRWRSRISLAPLFFSSFLYSLSQVGPVWHVALIGCRTCMTRLMPALAMGLSLPSDFFSKFHERADNQLRLLHYPEADRQAFVKGEKGRIGAHTVR